VPANVTAIDYPIDLPKWKCAAVAGCYLGQIGRPDGEKPGHHSATSSIGAMAYGARVLILEFPAGNDFRFLS
jgi:hypothetical protein